MPPELLAEGRLSKAADVYAFGVLLWELVTGMTSSAIQCLWNASQCSGRGKGMVFLSDQFLMGF